MKRTLLILLTALLLGPLSSLGQTTKGISKTSSETASGGPRTALVIGNARYTSAPLRNPVNDARASLRMNPASQRVSATPLTEV